MQDGAEAGRREFAGYVRALGRGPGLSRCLSKEEAASAMRLMLDGRAEPVQVGALLMLMRYRGESSDELAGLVSAARETLPLSAPLPAVDLDWPSYADRHKQLPWFVLAALLLAENGVRLLMHGIAGEAGFVSTRDALRELGVPTDLSPDGAAARLSETGFAYVGLESLSPRLHEIFALRPLFGLRSPVHSAARALNPFAAPFQVQGVFHPGYRSLHQETALRLDQAHAAVFKGGGGEVQRNPDKPCLVAMVRNGEAAEEEWPALPEGAGFRPRDEELRVGRIAALWAGETEDLRGVVAAITGTAAIALKLLGRAATMAEAQSMAEGMWEVRRALRPRRARRAASVG